MDKTLKWSSEKYSKGNVASYKPFNFVDGAGIRHSLYVSGCLFACKGCYNKAVQDFNYGVPYTEELEEKILNDLAHESVQGLTLLGGEPFLNTSITLSLCKKVRERFGNTKDIWAWTGYTYKQIGKSTEDKKELLTYIDVLVDGKFELDKKDLDLTFRGSSNQRIIDVPKSKAEGRVILWNDGAYLVEEARNKELRSILKERNKQE